MVRWGVVKTKETLENQRKTRRSPRRNRRQRPVLLGRKIKSGEIGFRFRRGVQEGKKRKKRLDTTLRKRKELKKRLEDEEGLVPTCEISEK